MSYTYEHARPSVTATIVILRAIDDGVHEVLFGLRKPTSAAYPNMWALPGGFMEAKRDGEDPHPGETIFDTAARELSEEINVEIDKTKLILYHVSSHPDTDPRAHVVNVCFALVLPVNERPSPGDDIVQLRWEPLESWWQAVPKLAFDHANLLHILNDTGI